MFLQWTETNSVLYAQVTLLLNQWHIRRREYILSLSRWHRSREGRESPALTEEEKCNSAFLLLNECLARSGPLTKIESSRRRRRQAKQNIIVLLSIAFTPGKHSRLRSMQTFGDNDVHAHRQFYTLSRRARRGWWRGGEGTRFAKQLE